MREVIGRKFGVSYTRQESASCCAVSGCVRSARWCGPTNKTERVRRWKEKEYPAIHVEAAAAGATIFFADEAGVCTDYHSGTVWEPAPVGRTPVVSGTGARLSVNMISAVSAQGKTHFSFLAAVDQRAVSTPCD